MSSKFHKPELCKVTFRFILSRAIPILHTLWRGVTASFPWKAQSISRFCDLQTSHGWHSGRKWSVVVLHYCQLQAEIPALVKVLRQVVFPSTILQRSPFPVTDLCFLFFLFFSIFMFGSHESNQKKVKKAKADHRNGILLQYSSVCGIWELLIRGQKVKKLRVSLWVSKNISQAPERQSLRLA